VRQLLIIRNLIRNLRNLLIRNLIIRNNKEQLEALRSGDGKPSGETHVWFCSVCIYRGNAGVTDMCNVRVVYVP
jgi:hypothetical protein